MELSKLIVVAIATALVVSGVGAFPGAVDEVTSLPDYGPLTSKNYAGYLNANNSRRAFYYFVESQGTPATDPVVLWLSGGPGCSSLIAFTQENGPYLMRHGGKYFANEFSWNKMANVLYIESPAGVGFSTGPFQQWDDDSTATFNYEALRMFFVKFPQFRENKFWLTGESYAGFYIPELAFKILKGEDAQLRSMTQGFMVGNPCTGKIGCANNDPTLLPFLQYNGFASFRQDVYSDRNAKYDPYDLLVPSCDSDSLVNLVRFGHPMIEAYKKRLARLGRGKLGAAPAPYGPCSQDHVATWFNRADVKSAIHADPEVHWSMCSNIEYTMNRVGVVALYQQLFSETKWSIMIYSGLDDSVVNQAQTRSVINNEMKRTITSDVYKAWYLPYWYNTSQTQLGGFFQLYDRIAWAGVRDAGHMVPQFNPPAAYELFKSFITTGKPGRISD